MPCGRLVATETSCSLWPRRATIRPQHPAWINQDASGGTAESSSRTQQGVCAVLDKPLVNEFSHVKPNDTPWVADGLRDFFLYRDLGIADATADG